MLELDKKMLTKLQRYNEWEALVKYYGEFIEKVDNTEVIGNSTFETLKRVCIKEGKKLGVREFFDNLDQQLYD